MIPLKDLTNIENYLNLDLGARECQKECFKTLIQHDKAIASMITGSGKSYIEYALVNKAFKDNYDINCIVTDSIVLGQQIALDYIHHIKDDETEIIIFNSDNRKKTDARGKWLKINNYGTYKELSNDVKKIVDREYATYKKENANEVKLQEKYCKKINCIRSTTDVNTIPKGKKVLLVSTYESFNKLTDLEFGTVVFDEAHSSDTPAFHKTLDDIKSKTQYFFTSTPKGDKSTKSGMLNSKRYGKIEYEIKITEAVNQNIIVPFAITTLINTEYDNDLINSKSVGAAYKFSKATIETELSKLDTPGYNTHPKIVINLSLIKDVQYVFEKLQEDGLKINIYQATSAGFEKFDYQTKEITLYASKIELIDSAKLDDNPFVLLNIYMLNVGIDLPSLTTLGLFRASNTISTIQSIGRILRVHNDDRNSDIAWSYGDINYNMKKPFGTVYLNISGPNKEASDKTFAESLSYLTSSFGSMLYIIEPKEPSADTEQKPILPKENNLIESDFLIQCKNIMLNTLTDMEEQEKSNEIYPLSLLEITSLFHIV